MWYSTGTITLTNNSPSVTGAGTAFVDAGIEPGYALITPDLSVYEIVSVVSNTQLVIAPAWTQANYANQGYRIMPTSSMEADITAAVRELISTFASVRNKAGNGIFLPGSASAPGVRFDNDQDTGLAGLVQDRLSMVAGGMERAYVDAAGISVPGGGVSAKASGGNASGYFGNTDTSGSYGTGINIDNANAAGSLSQIYMRPDGILDVRNYGYKPIVFWTASTARWAVSADGHMHPMADNTYSLGLASLRATQVYAGAGTINTSDLRTKTVRGPLTQAELAAAREIAAAIKVFQFNDAIAAKGSDEARLHVGVIAQEVISILTAHGLDWQRYAFVCHDSWDATPAVAAVPADPGRLTVIDEDGRIISLGTPPTPAVPAQPGRAAGDLYSVRYAELSMFIAAAQEQRIAALEAVG